MSSIDGAIVSEIPGANLFFLNPAGVIFFPQVPLPGSGGEPVQVTFDPDGSPRAFDFENDQYNFQPTNYLQVPLERESAALSRAERHPSASRRSGTS